MEVEKSMDARIIRGISLLALLFISMGADYRTPNFLIRNAPSAPLAKQLGETAERHRRELAILWTGEEMPRWSAPCPVVVTVGEHLGAGGSTTFFFDGGEVYGWQMNIQGSAQRLLDSVLPHEITHMIFASHFRRPLPRWLDEGGATSVEHVSERNNYHRMLIEFLHTNRGLPFNRMFALADYPPDAMPLYAQGHSVCDYLIRQGGHRHFVAFAEAGLESGKWGEAVKEYYGYPNLGRLQLEWVAWVGNGCPRIPQRHDGTPEATGPRMDSEVIPASHVAETVSQEMLGDFRPGSTARSFEATSPRGKETLAVSEPAPSRLPEDTRTEPLPSEATVYPGTTASDSTVVDETQGLRTIAGGRMVPVEQLGAPSAEGEENSVVASSVASSREPVAIAVGSSPPRRSTSRVQPVGKPRQQVLLEWSRF